MMYLTVHSTPEARRAWMGEPVQNVYQISGVLLLDRTGVCALG